jgi:hypothetical protein
MMAAHRKIERRIELPRAERGRSPEEIRRFDKLLKKLQRTDLSLDERTALIAKVAALEAEPADYAESEWRRQALAETEALAAARGEQVAAEKAGVKRLLDRDPLLSLARTGKITPEQLETGTEVRDLYDSRAQDAGAMEYTGMPSGGHNHERFVGVRYSRAKASAMIGRIERQVAIICAAEPMALTMMRVVLERGMPATSQGKGRAFERNVTALGRALDVAEDVLRRRL